MKNVQRRYAFMKIWSWKGQSSNAGSNDGGTNGSSDGDVGGRDFDLSYFERMKIKSHQMHESAEMFYGKARPKERKAGGKVKGFIKFVATRDEYKKYLPVKINKDNLKPFAHPTLFSAKKGGWHETTLFLKFFLLFNPSSLLLMAPLYALYGAEITYGAYKVAPRRAYNVKYNQDKKKNYRAQVIKRHSEENAIKRQEKAIRKAQKKEEKLAREQELQMLAQEDSYRDSTLSNIHNSESLESILS